MLRPLSSSSFSLFSRRDDDLKTKKNKHSLQGKLERCRADPEALADGASDDRARPAAVVLACSDARAPPELLFDAALGDLHVVRVAGGGVSPSRASPALGGGGGGGDASPKGDVVLASVLDGVLRGGARCVVVLGHSRCDAVVLAIEGWALLEARRKAAAAAAGGETGPPLAARCPSSSSTPSSVPASASSSPFASASQSPAASPLKAAAATHHRSRKGSEKERGGGFFARLFGRNSSAALPVSPDASGSGAGGNALHARRRTSSLEKKASQGAGAASAAETRGGSALGGNENSNHGPSHSHAQPLAAIADALSGAVEAVARGVSGGRFAKLATSMLSSSWNNLPAAAAGGEAGNGGGEEDAEDLSAARRRAAVALRSQDSIGIAHARFAKQRAQVACDEADAEGCVDDVVDEHVRRTVAVSWRVFFSVFSPLFYGSERRKKSLVFFSPALFFSSLAFSLLPLSRSPFSDRERRLNY